jgi:Protein of unknown function (DUF3105)
VSSRKQQKEALRRERLERERQAQEAQRRKRMVGFGIGGALALAAVVVLVVVVVIGSGGDGEASAEIYPDGGEVPKQQTSDLDAAVEEAGCRTTSEKSRSREHITDPNETVDYRTNPPTDGRHFVEPAEDGIYDEAPPDERLVHTLEHGRVIIWFKPSLPEAARANLKAFFDGDQYQMVLVPRAEMPYDVAASAWNREPEPNGTGRLLACPKYSERIFDALAAFREQNRSNGPEPFP